MQITLHHMEISLHSNAQLTRHCWNYWERARRAPCLHPTPPPAPLPPPPINRYLTITIAIANNRLLGNTRRPLPETMAVSSSFLFSSQLQSTSFQNSQFHSNNCNWKNYNDSTWIQLGNWAKKWRWIEGGKKWRRWRMADAWPLPSANSTYRGFFCLLLLNAHKATTGTTRTGKNQEEQMGEMLK